MTFVRLRSALAIAAATFAVAALAGCAPAGHQPAGAHTSGGTSGKHSSASPTPTPTPAVMVQPSSRYSFGCDDLIGASSVASLYSVPMVSIDPNKYLRMFGYDQIPTSEYLNDLGALDCQWYDGQKQTNNSHDMELQVMPVTLAEWNKYALGGATTIHNGVDIECTSDEGYNSCQYEAYVNGSRFTLDVNNMKIVTTGTAVLPPALKTIVSAITSKLNSAAVLPAAAPQQPSVTLPASGTAMITAAQLRTALDVSASAKMTVDCTGQADGPWEIDSEAQNEVDNSEDCSFGPPYDGGDTGSYGLFEWIPAGSWAATQLEGYTPTETPVSDPSLPAGDSLDVWTDNQGELNGDLVIGGNFIEINFFTAKDSGLTTGVPLTTAVVNIANALETTIRS